MDKARTHVSIPCPEHKDQLLVRANPDLAAQKHVYCVECLAQAGDPNLPEISEFLTTITSAGTEYKHKVKPVSEVPKEFLDVASSQTETLKRISNHIDGEKKKIEIFFENIKSVIVDALCQLKNEHLELLDKQVTNLQDIYVEYDKTLKKLYPKKEDIDIIFPTKEILEEKLSKVQTASDLEEFVKTVKQTATASKDSNLSEELKQDYLKNFKNTLKEIESNKPTFEETLTPQTAIDEIKKYLDQLLGLGKVFTLKNIIAADLAKRNSSNLNNIPESSIIKTQDFQVLKEWLPEGSTFNPTLLYRMTRDGRSGDAFHSRCDKKGSTITLIKCRYEGASQSSIIGGFSDKDFDQNGKGWVKSSQPFIFSLTSQIKCPVQQHHKAIWNGNGHNIWFGNGTVGIRNNLTEGLSYSGIAYTDSYKIIPTECYKGPCVNHKFEIEDVEVYQVN